MTAASLSRSLPPNSPPDRKIVAPDYLYVPPSRRLPWSSRARLTGRSKHKRASSPRRCSFAGRVVASAPEGASSLKQPPRKKGRRSSVMTSLLDRVLHKHKAKSTAELVARTGAALEKCFGIEGSAAAGAPGAPGGVPRTASGSGDGGGALGGGLVSPTPASEKWMDEVGRLLGAMKVRRERVRPFFFSLPDLGARPAAGWCFLHLTRTPARPASRLSSLSLSLSLSLHQRSRA